MAETVRDYDLGSTEAAHEVLVEVFSSLGEYRRHAVLVGGWVPFITCPGVIPPHCGSKDVDVALRSLEIGEGKYEKLLELLKRRDFVPKAGSVFSFIREVTHQGRPFKIQLDLLAEEYGGRGKQHRTQRIQDVRARKARGADLALADAEEVEIEGTLPSGAKNRVRFRVARPMPFLVMKAFAMRDRYKEKDAYDVFWIARYHPDGREMIADHFRRSGKTNLVREALDILREKFADVDRLGPVAVSDFLRVEEREREVHRRGTFQVVNDLLQRIR